MMKNILLLLLTLTIISCTHMQVVERDVKTGYFPTKTKANIVVNQKVDLDKMNDLLLVADQAFVKGQVSNINYFKELITLDDLEKQIIRNNLQDKIPSVRDKIGINNAYKNYKPFLWFRFDTREEDNKKYAQFILTNPKNLDDLFIAERELDYVWAGVHDDNTWYPLFNALIDYISENSKTYKK